MGAPYEDFREYGLSLIPVIYMLVPVLGVILGLVPMISVQGEAGSRGKSNRNAAVGLETKI